MTGTQSPPPPPPAEFGNYDALIEDDPSGWQLVRDKLMSFWPRLDYTVQQSRGSIVGVAESNDRKGWGGVYFVSKYSTSTAYLATAHFKDQNSLSARMWQARFTGMYRFACRAFMAFMSNQENAQMGSNQYPNFDRNAFPNSDDFTGKYDRNYLNMAAILFSQSYFAETGDEWHPNGLEFWDQNCVLPANDFSPVKKSLLERNPLVYGHWDFMDHEVPLTDFGPLFTYGSLRQLRDRGMGRLRPTEDGNGITGYFDIGGTNPERFPEDYTLHEFEQASQFFKADRTARGDAKSIDNFFKDVICNPTFKYTIENAVGNPHTGSNEIDGEDGLYDYEYRGNGRRLHAVEPQEPQGAEAAEAAEEAEVHNHSRRRATLIDGGGGPKAFVSEQLEANAGQYNALKGLDETHNDNQQNFVRDGVYQSSRIQQSVKDLRDYQGNLKDRFTSQIWLAKQGRLDTNLRVTEAQMGPTATKRNRYQGCGVGVESNGCQRAGTNYEQHSLWQWVYVTSSDEEDVPPGWHRLINFKGFSWKNCNENRQQVCHSTLEGKQPNFNEDEFFLHKFKKRMKTMYQSTLGVKLQDIADEKAAREAALESDRACDYVPGSCDIVDAIPGDSFLDKAQSFFGSGRRLFQLPNGTKTNRILVNDLSSGSYEAWGTPLRGTGDARNNGTAAWAWPVINRTATRLAAEARLEEAMKPTPFDLTAEARRQLLPYWKSTLVTREGVYDPDVLLAAVVPEGDWGFVANSTWNVSPEALLFNLYLAKEEFALAYTSPTVNTNLPALDERETGKYLAYRSGREVLFASRCSDLLAQYFPDEVKCCVNAPTGQPACTPIKWYTRWSTACNQQHLELDDGKDSTLSEEYLSRLRHALPPPSPPPSPAPPPPPSPPNSPPPPLPPIGITPDEGKALAKRIERRFCHSVYLLSAEARCSQLAADLQYAAVLGDGFSPPPPPPIISPISPGPPPPPKPPRPRLPALEEGRVVYQSPERVTMSTYFMGGPEDGTGDALTGVRNDMGLTNVANIVRQRAHESMSNGGREYTQWAACSQALREAPLPCRTGDDPTRCVAGARHCGTVDENTEAPWMELDLRDALPIDRDYYFFGLEIQLPNDPSLAVLFFQSAQGVSNDRGDITNRYYEVEVLDEYHNPLPTQCKPFWRQSVDVYVTGLTDFQYVCLQPSAEDAEYEALRGVRFVRITLLGSHRMIWLKSVRVVWRTLEELPPSAPPPPDPPPLNASEPRPPGAPPDPPPRFVVGNCLSYPRLSFGTAYPQQFEEPCGLSFDECCALSHEHNHTAVFTLTAAGCCVLFSVPDATNRNALATGATVPTEAFGFGTAATGVRDVAR
tara:strand:+ start:4191 stop:8210 length:4020 start_codon:yes stop_codon:yes gene_type:complete